MIAAFCDRHLRSIANFSILSMALVLTFRAGLYIGTDFQAAMAYLGAAIMCIGDVLYSWRKMYLTRIDNLRRELNSGQNTCSCRKRSVVD